MLNEHNFSPFSSEIWKWFQARSPLKLSALAVHEKVAHALIGRGANTLLGQFRSDGPIELDDGICAKIADHFEKNGCPGLPCSLATWPLPAKFELTAKERMAFWRKASKSALDRGQIDAATFHGFSFIEPYISPAGLGGWFVGNHSPVPPNVCMAVLAPVSVTRRPDNSLVGDAAQQRPPHDAAFNSGLSALRAQDYPLAMSLFQTAASGGHALAHFNIAWLLEQGLGAPQDEHAALRHYQAAADLGALLAHQNLGYSFLEGTEAVAQNVEQARHHFSVIADQGIAAAIGQLGDITYSNAKSPDDENKGLEMLLTAARGNDGHSFNRLANVLESKAKMPEDFEHVFKMYQTAHELTQTEGTGNFTPAYNLALCFLYGKGVAQNFEEAARLFQQAAQAGDMDAAYNFAMMNFDGSAGQRDVDTAYYWAKAAADKSHPAATNMLGYLYLNGCGVTASEKQAAKLFEQAASFGVADAQFNLAILHSNGLGVSVDHERVQELLSQAASQGHAKARHFLAQQ
jgi:TPR repeat protein